MSAALRQEALLLRYVAGLRARGLSVEAALELGVAALDPGALRDRARGALTAARAGQAPADPLQALLARDVPPAALQHRARAQEAQAEAHASLARTRLHVALGLGVPLLAAGLIAWLVPGVLADALPAEAASHRRAAGGVGALVWALRLGAPLLGGLALAAARWLPAPLAPGVRALRQAAGLLDHAATGAPAPALGAVDAAWLALRATGSSLPQASAELAAELLHRARGQVEVFRAVAPIAGFALGLLVLLPTMLLVAWSPYAAVGGVGFP